MSTLAKCIHCNKEFKQHTRYNRACSPKCRSAAYYQEKREEILNKQRRYYCKNKEKKQKAFKEWYEDNKEQQKKNCLGYYWGHKKQWNIRGLHNKYRDYYLEKFGNKCQQCESTENLELHHSFYENKAYSNGIILLCRACHRKLHRKV